MLVKSAIKGNNVGVTSKTAMSVKTNAWLALFVMFTHVSGLESAAKSVKVTIIKFIVAPVA